MKTKNILLAFLVIFLCIFGSSCSSPAWEPSPITHPYLIGTEECRPPCWEGIIPGETSFYQALVLIEDLKFINDKGALVHDDKSYIHWFRGDSTNASIKFYDNKLIYIRLDIVGGDLGSVTEHFGQPAGYTFVRDDNAYYIFAFYPNIGVVFIAGGNNNSLISRTMRVDTVYFLYPADKEDFPTIYNYNRKLADPRLREYDYYQWEGFGVDLSEKD